MILRRACSEQNSLFHGQWRGMWRMVLAVLAIKKLQRREQNWRAENFFWRRYMLKRRRYDYVYVLLGTAELHMEAEILIEIVPRGASDQGNCMIGNSDIS